VNSGVDLAAHDHSVSARIGHAPAGHHIECVQGCIATHPHDVGALAIVSEAEVTDVHRTKARHRQPSRRHTTQEIYVIRLQPTWRQTIRNRFSSERERAPPMPSKEFPLCLDRNTGVVVVKIEVARVDTRPIEESTAQSVADAKRIGNRVLRISGPG